MAMEYHTPSVVEEATALMTSGERTIVSGGTDFYPSRTGRPLTESMVDISGISELRRPATISAASSRGSPVDG